jgi:hypothetical protein
VQQLAVHYGKSPDDITEQELRQYFLYLCNEKRVAPASFNEDYVAAAAPHESLFR